MDIRALIGIALKVSIMLTVFGFGLQASREDLLYVIRRPRVFAAAVVSMVVAMPLFALFITRVISFAPAVAIALVALSISPVPPLLPKKITKSAGAGDYGLGLMVTAVVISVGFVPFAVYLIGRYLNRPFAIGPSAVAKLIVISVLIPLTAGIIVRKFAPAAAERISKPMIRMAGIVLLIGILLIMAFTFSSVWSLIGNGTILAFVVFVVVGLTAGHLLGGPNRDERVTLALATACRHPAIALTIGTVSIPEEHHVFSAIVLYLLVNTLLTIPYVMWQRKKAAEESVSVEPTQGVG